MSIILIVKDDNSIRQFLRAILTPEHQVVEAVTAAQATDMARLVQPDLILLGLQLQEFQDGLEVCRALRSDPAPALRRVPILMLTGYANGEDITAALAAGANAYASKPYTPTAILTLLDALLANRDV